MRNREITERAPKDAAHIPVQLVETPKLLLTSREVSELTGISVSTLSIWRTRKEGPRYVKFNRGIFYRPESLRKFFEYCEVRTIDMR
ncbi:helix-turn-helix domain-containing protein [Desulfobaculum bizertense]|uniref:helix-turn-helix transcriptional regulator n=1 Tax=Desulfobaculum bizertense TaxID=376490 RepID=UPI001F2DDB02|nr:helix-turn-helix domain-containing protein [Desulfobaculum bizertense]UIJ38495.1 helix-turn-helix domain-containing protein [Desulfobaculum bizertense]